MLASKRPFGAGSSPTDAMAQPEPGSVESRKELLNFTEKIPESSAPGWNFFIELLTWPPFSSRRVIGTQEPGRHGRSRYINNALCLQTFTVEGPIESSPANMLKSALL
jgi:hypothetical protein